MLKSETNKVLLKIQFFQPRRVCHLRRSSVFSPRQVFPLPILGVNSIAVSLNTNSNSKGVLFLVLEFENMFF
jgi:hypothetical protein